MSLQPTRESVSELASNLENGTSGAGEEWAREDQRRQGKNETEHITCFSGIKVGEMGLFQREETVQHCSHLFSEEESFQFVYQAGRLLSTSKERSFDARPSNLTLQIFGKTVGNDRFSYYSATETRGKQTCRENAVIAALLMAAEETAGTTAATDQH